MLLIFCLQNNSFPGSGNQISEQKSLPSAFFLNERQGGFQPLKANEQLPGEQDNNVIKTETSPEISK